MTEVTEMEKINNMDKDEALKMEIITFEAEDIIVTSEGNEWPQNGD